MATADISVQNMLPTEFRILQQEDASLDFFKWRADDKTAKGTDNGEVTFIYKKGILYRHTKKGPNQFKQMMVPESKRMEVLKLAHEGLLGAHMGIKKTRDRVTQEFYWP